MLPLQRFKDFIHQHHLFSTTHKVLLAVSGGKDSVLMVHLFKQCGYHFDIIHCNFNLRGDESLRDENFVRMLGKINEVQVYVKQFETKVYATTNKLSTQMAARDLRYQWFEEVRVNGGYEVVALAQHQDDAIETVLLNLTRGTGISGLHGILPKRDQLVRPMLFLTRAEIDSIVEAFSIEFVEDSSNSTLNYARNKIRHQVLPVLKELNPNLERTFEQNIQRFTETEMVLQQVVNSLRKDLLTIRNGAIHLNIEIIKRLHPQRLLLFELLKPYHFTEHLLEEVISGLEKQSGTSYSSDTHVAIIDREDLIITVIPEEAEEVISFIHHQDHEAEFLNQRILVEYSDVVHFERDSTKAFVDVKKLIYPLILRRRQVGDKFIPLGMKTFKKLSNFLIDEKVPVHEKNRVPILVNGNGEIIWVGGFRQDDRFKITGTTTHVGMFELVNIQPSP